MSPLRTLSLQDCYSACNSTLNCTNYSWSLNEDAETGTCRLHNDEPKLSRASFISNQNAVCGIILSDNKTDDVVLPKLGNSKNWSCLSNTTMLKFIMLYVAVLLIRHGTVM